MSLQLLEESVRALLASLCNPETPFEVINELFLSFIALLPRRPIIDDAFFIILERIRRFLSIEFEVQVINGSTETITKTSFGQMLLELAKKHYHTNDKHTCVFHPESLIVHLFASMTYAYGNVLKEYHLQEKFICCLTALLHDIGKVSCAGTVTIEHEKKYFTKFPFHGEMGSMILQRAFNAAFSNFLSKEEYESMCRAICVHMCGYHDTDTMNSQTQYKWDLLSKESDTVKQILLPLSLADTFAAFGNSEEGIQQVINSRPSFEQYIHQLCDLSPYLANGVIVQLKGTSGSGKSTIVRQLIELFGIDNIVLIDRDDIMTLIVADFLNEEYTGKASGEKYSRYKQIYTEEKLGGQVNAKMTSLITDGITKKKIVIIDSVMSLYHAIDRYIYPQMAKNAFKIAIHCVRNMAFANTDCHTRLGLNITKQIELSGNRDLFSCLPNGVIKGQGNDPSALGLHASLSSKKDIDNVKEKAIPSIVFTTVLLQDGSVMGFDYLMRFLNIVKDNIVQSAEVDTSKMTLIEFLNYKLTVTSWKDVVSYLTSLNFDIRIPSQLKDMSVEDLKEGSVFLMKYRDGLCNFWNARWARQMRGTLIRFVNGIFVLDKLCLQRGAEVLTGYLKKQGIDDTQDMSLDISMFDQVQQYVINTFLKSGNIDGAVSFKVDGSLFVVTLYTNGTEQALFWTNYVQTYGDDFNKAVLMKCQEMNLPFIAIFSSQGTALLGNLMQDYTVTSLFDVTSVDKSKTPAEIFAQQGGNFLKKIAQMYQGESVTMCFETVCKNRTTYLDVCHTELAVSYEKSFYRFLGLSVLNTNKYIPHYQIEELVHLAGFEQPNYWLVNHTYDVDKLMIALGKIIYGTSTVADFYKENPPHNKFLNASSFDYVDIEGFIFYLHTDAGVDYSKIKTPEYYICHKFRESNISTLIQLSQTAGRIFPLCRTVGIFYDGLAGKLKKMGENILFVLSANQDILKKTLASKAQLSFDTQTMSTKMKILVNTPDQEQLMELLRPIIIETFPIFVERTFTPEMLTEFNSMIRQMTMQMAPWTTELTLNIEKLMERMKGKDKCCLTQLFNFLLIQ
jgi:hypothetical protein